MSTLQVGNFFVPVECMGSALTRPDARVYRIVGPCGGGKNFDLGGEEATEFDCRVNDRIYSTDYHWSGKVTKTGADNYVITNGNNTIYFSGPSERSLVPNYIEVSKI